MSDYPTVPQEISQPIDENLQKLAELFPAAVKDGALDVEALREELGDFAEIQPGDEKYELNWVGKQTAKKKAFEPLLGKTLALKDDGKDADTTENLYIEGDNLEALKLLRQNYYGEVKMVYIDPPYNTGKDFVYTDKFKFSAEESEEEEGAVSETGERLVKNEKSSNRFHARWLDMVYPRLRLAKDLLREDGVIFISIDDNEVNNLRALCDEIYGAENFLGTIANTNNPKGRSDDKFVATAHEYVVVYSKSINNARVHGFEPEQKIIKRYNKKDDDGKVYREIDLRKTGDADRRQDRPDMFYYFYYNEEKKSLSVSKERNIETSEIEIIPLKDDGSEGRWRWGFDTATSGIASLRGKFMPTRKIWGIIEMDYLEGRPPVKATSSWTFKDVNSERGSEQFIELGFDKEIFPRPKPLGTLMRCIEIGTIPRESSLILDFFSGSASAAHAVMTLAAGAKRSLKYLLVQLPEACDEKSEAAKAGYATIAEIGKERIRRAGEKIKAELIEKGKTATDEEKAANPYLANPDLLDIGFKSFRIEDTKINWLKKDLRGEDLQAEAGLTTQDALDFVPGFTDQDIVYELMLRQSNIPLTHRITQPENTGKRTYLYGDSYLICLEESITKELVETLAALEPTPLKYFFRDSAFGKDIALKDETFRRLNAEIAKNFGDDAEAYTVEFI